MVTHHPKRSQNMVLPFSTDLLIATHTLYLRHQDPVTQVQLDVCLPLVASVGTEKTLHTCPIVFSSASHLTLYNLETPRFT